MVQASFDSVKKLWSSLFTAVKKGTTRTGEVFRKHSGKRIQTVPLRSRNRNRHDLVIGISTRFNNVFQ